MVTHAIILCAGEEERWRNYLGLSKHFIKIEGKQLIFRTIMLINKFKTEDTKIFVVGNDDRYEVVGSSLFVPDKNPHDAGADKFLNSKYLWNNDGRTIVFMGDVWFSENAMKSIMEYNKKEWIIFARTAPSKITGSPFPEIFAQSFYQQHLKEHEENLHKIVNSFHQNKINRCVGWEHYRCMIGLEPNMKHIVRNRIFEINDFTEDFDLPQDYDSWIIHREKSLQSKISPLQIIDYQIKLGIIKLKYLLYIINNKYKKKNY